MYPGFPQRGAPGTNEQCIQADMPLDFKIPIIATIYVLTLLITQLHDYHGKSLVCFGLLQQKQGLRPQSQRCTRVKKISHSPRKRGN